MRSPSPPPPVAAVKLSEGQRRTAHMAASLLLDYPGPNAAGLFETVESEVQGLPGAVREAFTIFIAQARARGFDEMATHYVATFDLKRKCCMYLSYYAAGDTRRRGMALVTFIEAYRAAGFEVEEGELPDYLPVVLEFSALSDSPIAAELLASHREGIEVLRAALIDVHSPYAELLAAVTMSLPEIDAATRERYLQLINEGPPAETVGLSFLGNLAPFAPAGAAAEGVRV